MFIQTEETPNPATLKFLPGRTVLEDGVADFPSVEAAQRSPLATRLFNIDGVSGVLLGGDFIAVTKAAGDEWGQMKPAILAAIMDHFTAGLPLVDEDIGDMESPAAEGSDSSSVAAIKELLETRVRPAVARDGGDIIFEGYQEGIVYLRLRGACDGCPSAAATLKDGIENLLRHYVPDVVEVRAV